MDTGGENDHDAPQQDTPMATEIATSLEAPPPSTDNNGHSSAEGEYHAQSIGSSTPVKIETDIPEVGGLTNGHYKNALSQMMVEDNEERQVEQNGTTDPDTNLKKRKRTQTPNSQAVSRGPSPPWKLPTIEGPSSFSAGGKRRSARTNDLPVDLQPGADLRRHTRAERNRAHGKETARVHYNDLNNGTTGLGSSSNLGVKPVNGAPKSPGFKTPALKQSRPPRRPSESHLKSPVLDRPQSSSNSVTYGSKKRRQSEGEHHPADHQKRAKTRHSDSLLPPTPNPNTQHVSTSSPGSGFKIRLRGLAALNKQTSKTMNPFYMPKPRQHGSFAEWFSQDDPWEGETDIPPTESETRKTAKILIRIEDEAQPGGLLSEERCFSLAPEAAVELKPVFGHWDHVVNQALTFRKLLFEEKKKHFDTRKRLAFDASRAIFDDKEDRFAKLRPSVTEEEREQKLVSQQRQRYQQVVRDITAKNDLLLKEIEKKRFKQWEEERHLQSKRAMDEMLEKSEGLLKQRRMRMSSDLASDEDESDYDESMTTPRTRDGTELDTSRVASRLSLATSVNDDDNNADESESDLRSGVMSEDDEDDEEEGGAVDEEADLTQDQLILKYADALAERSGSLGPEEEANEDDPNAMEDVRHSVESDDAVHASRNADHAEDAASRIPRTPGEHEDAQLADINVEEVGSVLDEDADMDSGSATESEESEIDEGSVEEDGSEEDEGRMTSMLGFLDEEDIDQLVEQAKALSNENEEMQDTEVAPFIQPLMEQDDSTEDNHVQPVANKLAPIDVELARTAQEEPKSQSDTPLALVNGEASTPAATSDKGTPTSKGALTSATSRSDTPRTGVATPKPKIDVSRLLRGELREYQQAGLEWLAGLHAQGSNGILADEMGLGKTIQTIALLCHVALHDEIWGPHLIVVPTSVILNWEMEFKKWAPGFKVLTYYGSQEERAKKRKGWGNDDMWNVVVTSYQMVVQDIQAFRKRAWHYLVLDEAHQIKNYQTQKWQKMLNMRTEARLLLTGTPLQNNLSELWSLLFFLMPTGIDGNGGFAELEQFTNAMKRPADQILGQGRQKLDKEAQAAVAKLHEVLRPYLLRRLKADVEKQMPGKFEHVVHCRLSKRQRQLYDGFMGRADTKRTLASGNYMSIIQCLMNLKKVCNHPDLFEERPIVTSFALREDESVVQPYEIEELLVRKRLLEESDHDKLNLDFLNLKLVGNEGTSRLHADQTESLQAGRMLADIHERASKIFNPREFNGATMQAAQSYVADEAKLEALDQLKRCMVVNSARVAKKPVYGKGLIELIGGTQEHRPFVRKPTQNVFDRKEHDSFFNDLKATSGNFFNEVKTTILKRSEQMGPFVQRFSCATPAAKAMDAPSLALTPAGVQAVEDHQAKTIRYEKRWEYAQKGRTREFGDKIYPTWDPDPFDEASARQTIAFPDSRLLQYDCGKLQELAEILKKCKAGGHRALIFTQMTKVLDILERFLNIHGHRYLRLDGSTPIEQRQILTQRFNERSDILCFILSSRSGGIGINLTGADNVIFYDMDWNPAMDKQCQDRCHRIGQTREVHIHRLVSEYTIEANILRKSNQKRLLDDVIIQKGEFTTDYFNRVTYKDAFGNVPAELDDEANAAMDRVLGNADELGGVFQSVEDTEDATAAAAAQKEARDIEVIDEQEQKRFAEADENGVTNEPEEQEQGYTWSGISNPPDAKPHVEEYMLALLDKEMKGVPIVFHAPAKDKKAARRAKDKHRKR